MKRGETKSIQKRQYLFLLRELVSRELKRKYSRSRLGILWSILNPLLSMAVLSMVFSSMFRHSIENYPIYYLTGNLCWSLFTTSTNTSMTALVDNQTLLLQVKAPKMIFPLARVAAAFVNFLYSLAAYGVMLAVSGIRPDLHMLLFPAVAALLLLFAVGCSFILTIAYVFFGDIRHLYSVLLTLWMYLSALFYPVEAVPEFARQIIVQNPVYNYVTAARACMLYQTMPGTEIWIRMILWAAAALWAGWLCFGVWQDKIIQKL